MNCFEFRRLCLSVPNSGDPEYLAHAGECDDCRKYAAGVRGMDTALIEALDVSIPEDLVARLKLRTVIASEHTSRKLGMRFALAASVVLAVSAALFGYRTWSVDQQYQQLTQAVITHIEHEHAALDLVTDNAPDVLASMFVDYGAKDAQAVNTVRFSMLCPVMGKTAIHAVLSTPSGPVTLIFVPDTVLPEVRDALQEGLNNHLVPMGNGTMILTGQSAASFEEITDQISHAVEWEI